MARLVSSTSNVAGSAEHAPPVLQGERTGLAGGGAPEGAEHDHAQRVDDEQRDQHGEAERQQRLQPQAAARSGHRQPASARWPIELSAVAIRYFFSPAAFR